MSATFVIGDVRACLAALPDGSVDLVATSPPFLALRSYLPPDHPDKHLEIGSEPTPAAFLSTLLGLTAEWGRVLAPHGSIFVELGDTYSGSGGAGGDYADGGLRDGQERFDGSASRAFGTGAAPRVARVDRDRDAWPLAKSLCAIPQLYEVALAYGIHPLTGAPSPAGRWRVRNEVAWVRPNPPVGALGDKVRTATSYAAWACLSDKRWFDLDAVRIPKPDGSRATWTYAEPDVVESTDPGNAPRKRGGTLADNPAGAPPLDWWSIPPGGYPGSHYAVFPPELVRRPIQASCPRRVCRTCGTPSTRITGDKSYVKPDGSDHQFHGDGFETHESLANRRKVTGFDNGNMTAVALTLGWSSCGCPGTDGLRLDGWHTGPGWRPGVVLDPFAGSGTTLMVAGDLGRDAIGFDLDERNADLARERCGMFLEAYTLDEWKAQAA